MGFKSHKLHHSWEIKPQLPWYKKTSVILSLSIVFTSLIGSYVYLNYTLYTTNQKLFQLSNSYEDLNDEFLALKSTKVRLQRELEIAKQSQTEIKTSLLDLHQANQDLSEQLDLYKRIMSANQSAESILVENLQVRPLEDNEHYILSMVLLQASKKRTLQQGLLNIKFSGQLGDSTKVFNYSQLAANNDKSLPYKFRDFQHFNNKLVLPKDYIIDNITIEILDNKTKTTKSKNFTVTMIGRKINVAKAQDKINRFKSNA